MALTKLIGSIIAKGIWRKAAGQLDELVEGEVGVGKVVHFDPAGSITTTTGVGTLDLTATFSVIDAVWYTNLDDTNVTFVDDPAGDATAGQLKVKMRTADTGAVVGDGAKNVAILVIGTPA